MSQLDLRRVDRQRFARNEARPQLRELSLRFRGEISVEMLRDDELKDRIAQKFQPLIIEMAAVRLVPQTRVGERFRQEQRIAELVTDAFFERVHRSES